MNTEKTSWTQSVAGVLIKDNKVLLARHTYGSGKNLLIIPGGYIELGEMPEQALKREFMEEVGLEINIGKLIGIRFNTKDWYAVFKVSYVSGLARSDNDENSEVIWMDINSALSHADVPDLTKKLIDSALNDGFGIVPYIGKNPPYVLYGNSQSNIKQEVHINE